MLQSIRDRLTGILAFFILGILIIPFAFVGVNSYFSSGNENIVARVNDAEITYNDFNQSYSNYRRRMQALMGPAFDPLQFDSPVARREHLESMIDQEVIQQAANSMGLAIDDNRLAQEIRRIPAFQVDGVFNADVYQNRLLSEGMTPSQFEADMRAQSVFSQLPTAVLQSSLSTPAEIDFLVGLQEQTRQFQAVLFPASLEAVSEAIADADIDGYYQANPDRFQSEEQVTVDYLELSAVDVSAGTEPDEEFLRQRFEQQKGRFITPEQRRASHILIEVAPNAEESVKETARQTAADLSLRARSGEDFAELAREYSDDAGSAEMGGDLGWIEPGLMSELFEEALYALTGESPISEPVQTGFGWHVIRLDEIEPSSGMSFEEARPILIEEHQQEEAEREYLDMADRLVDIIYEDPTTLDSAALDLGLEVKTEGPFSRSGSPAGIAANPDVVEAAFSELVMSQESVSDPVDLGDNHMVVIKLREHFPAALRPLAEVRDEIVLELRRQRASEAARASAGALLAELDATDSDLEALVADREIQVVSVEAAKRTGTEPDPVVVSEVFKLQSPVDEAPVTAVVEAMDGFAAVVLQSVTRGELQEGALFARQQYQRRVANAAASAETSAMLEQLRRMAAIEIYEDRLQ
jgi:peptidyl-prolyl cis-trans isomerase D